MGNKSVCYNCPSRTIRCHCYCTDYIEEQKQREQIREQRRKDNDFLGYQKTHKTRIEKGGLIKKGVQ